MGKTIELDAGLNSPAVGSTTARGGILRRSPGGLPSARLMAAVSLLLVLALAVRVGYVLATHKFVATHDQQSYNHLATVLAQGHGWAYRASAFRPPGYPYFLAGIYSLIGIPQHDNWTSTRLIEAVLATIAIGLIGLMALQVAGRVAMLITLAIGALYVPLVVVGVSLLTESLLIPLILAATNCALRSRTAPHRYRWILAAGFFAGLAALTRGNGIVAGVALGFVVWTGKPTLALRAILAPATLLVVMALTLMPWTIRNANAQHAFVPVTTELGATLSGTYNDYSATKRFIWEPSGYHNYDAIKNNKRLSEAQQNTRLTSAVLSYVAQHPTYLPQALFWNTMRLLDLQGRRVSRMTARTDENLGATWADAAVIAFWLVGSLAIIGTFTTAAHRVPRALWILPLFLWLSVAPVTTGTPRFRSALEPFIVLLAALAIQAIGATLLRWHRRREGQIERNDRPGRGQPVRTAGPSGRGAPTGAVTIAPQPAHVQATAKGSSFIRTGQSQVWGQQWRSGWSSRGVGASVVPWGLKSWRRTVRIGLPLASIRMRLSVHWGDQERITVRRGSRNPVQRRDAVVG
jgi:4-amino-4-deoxy-L-arabinose transferase-like glycosyltransferase